jgi:hypothetical protein
MAQKHFRTQTENKNLWTPFFTRDSQGPQEFFDEETLGRRQVVDGWYFNT